MAIEVFNRYEYKYVLPLDVAEELMERFKRLLILDDFCKKHSHYKIINYYIDTLDYQLIRDSIDKPLYKHKLRLRAYEPIKSNDDYVYFEIKKKYKGLVNKRRCKLTCKEAMDLIKTQELPEIKPYMNEQILKEIHYIIKQSSYEVKTKITYDRIAFFSEDKSLRISFDFNVYSQNKYFLDRGCTLMEIKTPDSIPLWLTEILNEFGIKKQSFSKYGSVFIDKLKEEKYERIIN